MTEYSARKERHPTTVDAHVYRADGRRHAVKITEMSHNGCRIEGTQMPIGEAVRIAIPRMGQIRAHIRWSIAGASGARFDNHAAS